MSDALILIGSPRAAAKATSRSLGSYLQNRLCEKGMEVEALQVQRSLTSPVSVEKLLEAVKDANTLVFVAPLYVDAPPAPVIRLMELIRDRASSRAIKRVAAISNCGFPEAEHNDTALGIYRIFARQCGYEWAGGLALGMGEVIEGAPLDKTGWMARNVRASLDLAAEAIARGKSIPQEADELMRRRLLPARGYIWLANRSWKKRAKRHGMHRELRRRPWGA